MAKKDADTFDPQKTILDPGDIELSNEHTLLPDLLPHFVSLLVRDDVDGYKTLEREQSLKHGRFVYTTVEVDIHKEVSSCLFEIPLHVAVGYGSINVVQEMIRDGAELHKLDINQCNILHVISIACSQRRHAEESYTTLCNLILQQVSSSTLTHLCYHVNSDGLRPLELAAKLGTFGIFRSLLLKPGYLCGSPHLVGHSRMSTYDLTEYEDSSDIKRLLRSPLRYLVYATTHSANSLKNNDIMHLSVVQEWIRLKIIRTLPFIVLWWCVRLAYIGLVCSVDPSVLVYNSVCDNRNRSFIPKKSSDPQKVMRYERCMFLDAMGPEARHQTFVMQSIISNWSWVMVVIDLVELVICLLHRERHRAFKGLYLASFISYTRMHRLSQFLLYLVGAIGPVVANRHSGADAYLYLLAIKTTQLPCVVMSFLYVFEFLPVIGIFSITLQRMIRSLFAFLTFFIPMKLIFSAFFQMVALGSGFDTVGNSVYLLFLMDMGAYDFGTDPAIIIRLVHVFYFLMMAILLLNYLIGIMSIVADKTEEDKLIMVNLRRLQMVILVEERVVYWVWKIVIRIRGKRPILVNAKCPY